MIIPPRASAVLSTDDPDAQSPRDRHIRLMAERGRIGWQRATGYGRRNHAETAMGRYKHLIGPKLRARTLSGQQGEVAIGVSVLNRMIRQANQSPFAPDHPNAQSELQTAQPPCTNALLRQTISAARGGAWALRS